ncbi:MAG: proline dehydrogenase family protein [Dehalococcoidia bacterium]
MALDPAVEARVQEIGRALIERAERYRPGLAERIEDWLLTNAVADERFRTQLLRYMDVLASLDHDRHGHEAKRLAGEYFGDDFPQLPRPLRWLLRVGRDERLPAPVVGETATRAAELFARRFITPPGEERVRETLAYLDRHGRVPSFDLLGEAVLSESESLSYVERYLAMVEQLGREPQAGRRTAGDAPMLQLSIKLSSLTSLFTPVDAAGTVARVRPPLEAIAEAARRAGIGLTVDMEQHAYRDLTWRVFRETFARGERLGDWADAGIVLQAYLRTAEADAASMVAFASARGTPFQVRLVKGAYWDYETITAAANQWPAPVWTEKAATDVAFERTIHVLLGGHPRLRLAVASHNARSHAVAEALAQARGLPAATVEHQTLFRTYEGMSRALADMGWPVRDYVPVGELLPGMAYLVRRVLENSSQAGFLLQSRGGAEPEDLLRPPSERSDASAAPPDEDRGFVRMAEARWFDPAFRDVFEAALASTRAEWGRTYELRLGDEVLPGEHVEIRSPSHPDAGPVGVVPFLDAGTARRVASAVRERCGAWAATPADERGRVLRRAADLLERRAHEFAAWIVHEGGRDRAGAWAEVVEAVDYLRYYAAQAEELWRDFGGRVTPRGVVAVIPPWNFSLAIPCGMTAAALATGNGVVLKPAGQTPLIALRLTSLLQEAGIPRGALVCLPGHGADAGQALVDSPDIAMVAFTGSRAVGARMREDVARVAPRDGVVKALVAEMGGKNAALVFADADMDEAVNGIVHSAFGHANQKCSAVSRVLVERSVVGRFRERLVEAARSLRVGPADEAATQVNPIIDRRAWGRLQGAAEVARQEGVVLLDLFDAVPLLAGPLIVEVAPERALASATATEELFGPILVVIPFDREEQAYEIANGTAYALTAGVFSRSPATVERSTSAVRAGNVYVNRGTTGARPGIEPFGGMAMSGTGPKAGGPDYLWAFVRRTDTRNDEERAVNGSEPTTPPALAARWEAPLDERIAILERAAVRIGGGETDEALQILDIVQAARRELGRPAPTPQAAGQHTELRYDWPRGRALVAATGPGAVSWLVATLVAGNSAAVIEAPRLREVVEALRRDGVPGDVIAHLEGGDDAIPSLAGQAWVDFVATDAGVRTCSAVYGALGPTEEGPASLKALVSPLDGPQPGEAGFVRRFAWPRAIAVRTLRHGADLALERREPHRG